MNPSTSALKAPSPVSEPIAGAVSPTTLGVTESSVSIDGAHGTSIELFTGAGGLALGVRRAQFRHELVLDNDPKACDTIRENNRRRILRPTWPVHEGDIRRYDLTPFEGRIDLLAAGAPCQPFSLGGRHQGAADSRNLLPEVVRAVREVKPLAFLLENVRGLVRPSFEPYFEYFLWQLERPEMVAAGSEGWPSHKERMDRDRTSVSSGLSYSVHYRVLDAADYGAPQRRQRVIVVGLRSDVAHQWEWPEPTHSRDVLRYAQWVDGSYWAEHNLTPRQQPSKLSSLLYELRANGKPLKKRWRTVRDALSDLPPPAESSEHPTVLRHTAIPGARRYTGHDGSRLDDPAKTLKAGVHGVPGGEGTIILDDGSVRYLSIREAARIQTFPDSYEFCGTRTRAMRQIGNAMPPLLAYRLASQLRRVLRA